MKIFITGAAGFIGTHLVEKLSESRHELYCFDIKKSTVDQFKDFGVHFITGNVTDKDSVLKSMKGCDWVINLAAIYSFWEPDKQIYNKVNIEGTRNVMECALETGVSKVLHVSTSLVYGKPKDSPFTEKSRPGPIQFSEYARAKYAGEQIAWELYEKKGLPLVMIYPSAVIGPGDNKSTGQYIKDLINRKTLARVFEDANVTLVHVNDVVEVIIKALEKENNLGEKYLVGKYQLSLRDFNEMISEISGVPLPRISLPDSLVVVNATILTLLADLIRKPPLLGISRDQVRTMSEGWRLDGSKAERELGITYTPIRIAVEEAIASYRE